MEAALIGPEQTGKTSLFSVLSGLPYTELAHSRAIHRGVVKYEDPRLYRLAELVGSEKITPAYLTIVDLPGLTSSAEHTQTYPPQLLGELRGVDLLVLVVREYAEQYVGLSSPPSDPFRQLEGAELEFIINDLATVEKRLERLAKHKGTPAVKGEKEILEKCKALLDEGVPLRAERWMGEEEALLRGFGFLSLKPLLVVFNTSEEKLNEPVTNLPPHAPPSLKERSRTILRIAVKWEEEVMRLDPSDREAFLQEAGITQPAPHRFIEAAFDLLGIITFFTLSPRESTAWAIPRGSTALIAAGTIHQDMARGFIRAEVCRWDELLAAGSFTKLKEEGRLRGEGKEYIVQDGDVLHIRFSH